MICATIERTFLPPVASMYEILRFLDYFNSNYGRHPVHPKPQFHESWSSIFRRIPELEPGQSRGHMQIAYDGELMPFSSVAYRRMGKLRSRLVVDVIGPPKSFKSTILRLLEPQLAAYRIPYIMYFEPKRVQLPEFNSRADINIIRLLWGAERLESRRSQYEHGGGIQVGRRVQVHEQSICHSVVYAHMQEMVSGKPAGLQKALGIAGQVMENIDVVLAVRARPDVSAARRAKMPFNDLLGYQDGMLHFPRYVAHMTRNSPHPVVIMNLDTSHCVTKNDTRDVADLAFRSLGTVLTTRLPEEQL